MGSIGMIGDREEAERELGSTRVEAVARRVLGDRTVPFRFGYHVRVGIVVGNSDRRSDVTGMELTTRRLSPPAQALPTRSARCFERARERDLQLLLPASR